MNRNIKIAVIGGTGKSGKYLVDQLMEQGFHFNMLLRNPQKAPVNYPDVQIVVGDVTNYKSVLTLLDGCDAVISTLGLGIPISEPNIFSRATTHILKAMKACGIRRYIVTTGLNVDAPSDKKNPQVVAATNWMKTNFPISTADKQTEYGLLTGSNIDWTLVRLPVIKQTEQRFSVIAGMDDCAGESISATDLAHFLIRQLFDESYIGKSPFLFNN